MKRNVIYGCLTAILLLLPFFSACQSDTTQVSTTPPIKTLLSIPELPSLAILLPTVDWPSPGQTPEAPDDIVTVPGGAAYRANVHQADVPDKWPSILLTNMVLDNGFDTLRVNYRSYIETKAGETRYNIISASINISNSDNASLNHELTLYSLSLPKNITLGMFRGGGIPGTSKAVLTIEISPYLAPGKYSFDIGIVLDGTYFGAVPCTVNVTQ